MSSVIVDVLEITSSIPASRLFRSFIVDSDNLMPKVLPGFFKGFQTLSGDGGAGTIKVISWAEGGALGDGLEQVSYDMKVGEGPDGGCEYKVISKYHVKGGDHNAIQEKIKQGTEGAKAFFHAVEAYLQANPNEYN